MLLIKEAAENVIEIENEFVREILDEVWTMPGPKKASAPLFGS